MLSSLLALGAGAGLADALAIRGSECSVHFTVDGAVSGDVGQISSGQVRAGDGIDSATFSLKGDQIWDSKGRGCWWTPPTHLLQCDEGQTPDDGWEIGCDGAVTWKGHTSFYECDTDQEGQYNLYLMESGTNCNKVTLMADGCHDECPPPPPPPQEGCPTNLDGTYEFPHLIIPVDKSNPDKASGTSYNGLISSTVSSDFNFDIPNSYDGKQCSLVFLFPKQEDLETSSFTFEGSGGLGFTWLDKSVSEDTTYNNKPGVKKDLGDQTVAPGNSYSVATFDCPAGETIAFEIGARGDTYLKYFQDYNPSPIGLYITVC